MAPKLTALHDRIRALDAGEFQALTIELARRKYGDRLEGVNDLDGQGNGADGVLDLGAAVHVFQARRVERHLGDSQRRRVRESFELAAVSLPKERGKPLKRMTFIFSVDLQPEEAGWFEGYATRVASDTGIVIDYHGLSWVVGELLRPENTILRKLYAETESDRTESLAAILNSVVESLVSADRNQQTRMDRLEAMCERLAEEVRRLATNSHHRVAIATLLDRAAHMFNKAMERVEEHYYLDAQVWIDEAIALLKGFHEEPLFLDLLYWRGVALFSAGHWQDAEKAFTTAADAYERAGKYTDSQYCRGNRARAIELLGKPEEALSIFRSLQPLWQRLNDRRNYLGGCFNQASALERLQRYSDALVPLDEAEAILRTVTPAELGTYRDCFYSLAGLRGVVLMRLRQDEAAIRSLESGVGLAHSLADEYWEAKLRMQQTIPLLEAGRLQDVATNLNFAEAIFRQRSDDHNMSIVYNHRALLSIREGNVAQAVHYYRLDEQLCLKLNDKQGLAQTRESLRELGAL